MKILEVDLKLENVREVVSEPLPTLEVFPKHIRELLLGELSNLDETQLELLEKILLEERDRLGVL